MTTASDGTINLGYRGQGTPLQLTTLPISSTDIAQAARPALLLNFAHYDAPLTFTYAINGHQHTMAWPYPELRTYTWRTLELPIDVGDLVAGPNLITVSVGSPLIVVSNVDILLRPGGTGSLEGPSPSTTPTSGTGTPTATGTLTLGTSTPTATGTGTAVATSATATSTPTAGTTSTPITPTKTKTVTPTKVPATPTSTPAAATPSPTSLRQANPPTLLPASAKNDTPPGQVR